MESSTIIVKHISDLPEEVLIKILENLAVSDLINATLVCKYFNRTMSSSGKLMNRVMWKQEMYEQSIKNVLDSLPITRQYKNVDLNVIACMQRLTGDEAKKLFKAICTPLQISLTTLKLRGLDGFTKIPENMPVIASCKFIQTLIIEKCYCSWWEIEVLRHDYGEDSARYWELYNEETQHNRTEFINLRHLELIKSSSVILNFIICKQLNKFRLIQRSRDQHDNESTSFWNFVDQLERCDELDLKIKCSTWSSWNWTRNGLERTEIPEPKFAWNKLKLALQHDTEGCGEFNEDGLLRIAALCRASSPTAEAVDVQLKNIKGYNNYDDYSEERLGEFFNLILTHCDSIASLSLLGKTLGSAITNEIENLSQKLAAIKKLEIHPQMLKDRNSVDFMWRLPIGVSELKLRYDCRGVKVSTGNLLALQSFFDQITDLTVPDDFMERTEYSKGVNHIKEIQFNNLQSLTIDLLRFRSWELWRKIVVLRKFAQRNQTLRHLNVIIGEYVKDFSALVKLHSQLRDTGILTCNVMIFSARHQSCINWRSHPNLNEMRIFGKILSENENRFFV